MRVGFRVRVWERIVWVAIRGWLGVGGGGEGEGSRWVGAQCRAACR